MAASQLNATATFCQDPSGKKPNSKTATSTKLSSSSAVGSTKNKKLVDVLVKLCRIVLAFGVISISALGILIYEGRLARPITWRFAPGYRGWVTMEFQNFLCPPLTKEGLFLIIVIPPSGRGCTSFPFPEGWRYTRYENMDSARKKTQLHANGWGTNSEIWPFAVNREKEEWYLFVGSEAEFRRSGKQPH